MRLGDKTPRRFFKIKTMINTNNIIKLAVSTKFLSNTIDAEKWLMEI